MALACLWKMNCWVVGRCSGCGSKVLTGQARAASSSTPSRVVVLMKTTRLEYQIQRQKLFDEEELQNWRAYIGSAEYDKLVSRHKHHHESVDIIEGFLRSRGVEVRLRTGPEYTTEDVKWADSIFSAGGDGTFLCASSKVLSPDKLVVGFNTDLETSEGFLCFNSGRRYSSLVDSLEAMFRREIPRYRRARIRVEKGGKVFPVRALNEVFVGEKNPSHASYYELYINGIKKERQKSSGLLIYTGTGSTSWAYNINNVRKAEVEKILSLYRDRTKDRDRIEDQSLLGNGTISELASEIVKTYNQSMVNPANHPDLSYVVREPINQGIFTAQHLQGTALSIAVKSLTWNTQLIVDGNHSCDMGGETATCFVHPQDTLTTLYHP